MRGGKYLIARIAALFPKVNLGPITSPTGPRTVVHHPAGPPALDPLHPLPAATLGGYELRRWIGEGGMATVYEAWSPRLARMVAVKVLRQDLTIRSQARSRFLREAHGGCFPPSERVGDLRRWRGTRSRLPKQLCRNNLTRLSRRAGK